jgi:L-fucose isomerase-like protein
MATFGLIVCNRSFFPDHVVAAGRKELVDCLAQWGHDSVVLTENETKGGGVETIQDARKCAQLFRENAAKIDGIIISMPNFGDELSVTEVITQAKLNVPILIQASNDQLDKLDLANRRDAFCGKISVCNNFRQCGIKFSLTEKHTCQVNSPVCDVVKGLTNARIAAIGARPDAFHTVRYSEKLLQRSGINVSVVDMSMILHHARSINDQSLIDAKIAEIKEYGNVSNDASPEQIDHEARLSIAIESYVDDNECTSSAVQCWDAVETDYGVATCLPMSMMGMRGKPSACEMDVMGALSMQALLLAGGVPPMLQDWNNNYGSEPDKCINVHCSNFPSCVFEKTPEIGYLDVLSTTLGVENCFGACKGRVAPGPMTYLRISTDDCEGKIRCYVGEGEFTDDPLDTFGGITVCKVDNMNGLMKYICEQGFEHHIAISQSSCADVLEEAIGKYLGWDVYRHS